MCKTYKLYNTSHINFKEIKYKVSYYIEYNVIVTLLPNKKIYARVYTYEFIQFIV